MPFRESAARELCVAIANAMNALLSTRRDCGASLRQPTKYSAMDQILLRYGASRSNLPRTTAGCRRCAKQLIGSNISASAAVAPPLRGKPGQSGAWRISNGRFARHSILPSVTNAIAKRDWRRDRWQGPRTDIQFVALPVQARVVGNVSLPNPAATARTPFRPPLPSGFPSDPICRHGPRPYWS